MFHIPAHRNLQNPPAQIREGELQVNPQALQARRNEMYGRKARKADQIARQAIKRHLMEETS